MKFKKLAVFAAASACILGMSMTAFATKYQDWYYNMYGYYPSDNSDDWDSDPAYQLYLSTVTSDVDDSYWDAYYDAYYNTYYDTYYNTYYDYDSGSYYAAISDAFWSGSTAKWSVDGKATKYQVRVYRDGSRIDTKDTKNKSYSLGSLINKEGYYYFEVRAYNKNSGWSDWYESDDKYFSAQTISQTSNNSGTQAIMMIGPGNTVSQSQWIQATDGTGRWWYKHADGGCTKNAWECINSKWYYFDEAGWMKTGWLNLNGSTYYLGSDGAMVTGMMYIDGANHNFDSNGRMVY